MPCSLNAGFTRIFGINSFGSADLTAADIIYFDSVPGGMGKIRDMNIQDHFSESLETDFWVKKYLTSLMRIRIRDGKNRIRDKHPGSATLDFLAKHKPYDMARPDAVMP